MQNVGTTYLNKSFGLFYASRRIYNISNEHPQYIDILKLKRAHKSMLKRIKAKKSFSACKFFDNICVHLES